MDVEIRTIAEDEYEKLFRAVVTAFGDHVRPEDIERERRMVEMERCLAALDGEEFVGGATAVSFRMTIPGGTVPAAGVTGVGVKPTHRRRGINSALMRRQLDDVHTGPEPIAALYASEGGIYGHFGYGLASFMCSIDIECARTAYVRGYQPSGRMRLLERDEALKSFLPLHDRLRRERPGMIELDEKWFDYRFAETHFGEERKWFYAAHEGESGLDAYAAYLVKHDWSKGNELQVEELQALTPQAFADMWRYCFDVDLIHRVTAWNRPVDEPLLNLLREPRWLQLRVRDGLWVRLVDIPEALEARRYSTDGRVVFEVRDRFCPWNEGRFALEGAPEGASCRPTNDDPGVVLSVNELGAVYLGGTTFRRLHRAGLVREERSGELAAADAMFAWDPAPWCSLVF